MSDEIMHVLKHVKDENKMRDMFLRMTFKELHLIFNMLEFLDEETQKRWINVYNTLDKNNK